MTKKTICDFCKKEIKLGNRKGMGEDYYSIKSRWQQTKGHICGKCFKRYIKNAKIYPGLAYVISTKSKPGLIEQRDGLGKLIFGDRKNPNNPFLKEVEKIMKAAEIDATFSDDIEKDVWKKFIFIVACLNTEIRNPKLETNSKFKLSNVQHMAIGGDNKLRFISSSCSQWQLKFCRGSWGNL